MIAVVDAVIIVAMEIESEIQLKSDNWQAISHQARIEQARSKLHLLEINLELGLLEINLELDIFETHLIRGVLPKI